MTNEKHVLYLDVLKLMAIIGVITIHVSGPVLGKFFGANIIWWLTGNFYSSISRFAVPIMIMISGACLLDPSKDYSLKVFFKKRFNKVLLPFLFWALVYTIWKYFLTGKPASLLDAIKDFLIGPIYYHLWFVYTILGLYLATPILKVYIKNATDDNMKYFLTLWFISTGIIFFISRLLMHGKVKPLFEVYFFTGFIGYFVLGYYLNKLQINKRHVQASYLIFLFGFIMTMVGTYILTDNKKYVTDFQHSFAPNIILMSIGVFIMVKSINWNNILNNNKLKMVSEISSYCFGIYLIHVIMMELLRMGNFNVTLFNPILSIPLMTIAVLLSSYIIVKIMSKLPLVKKFVP